MAITLSINDIERRSTRNITVDFVAEFLASEKTGVSDKQKYFLKFTTSARDTNNMAIPVKIAQGLDDLVLNGQSQRRNQTSDSYSDIKSLILDYLYDYINGHSEDLWGTGVDEQAGIRF